MQYSNEMNDEISLELEPISLEQVKTHLMMLSPENAPVVAGLDLEIKALAKEKIRRRVTGDLEERIDAIIQYEEREIEFRELLRNSISKCLPVTLFN
ncbi:MAG: hypothetical protein ACI865_001085 [Flavobacteriaceae bacterium]|jgi:hypothetical protein